MISLAYPWLLILLPVPLLAYWLLPAWREGQSSLRIPRLDRLAKLTGGSPAAGAVVMQRTKAGWLMLALSWVCVLAAVTRPQWIGEPITKTIPSRDMLLAVDLSGSMSTEDFTDAEGNKVDRLTACKQVLNEFLTRREGDRVGLIFFGSAAFVQAPFTEDLDLLRTLLDEAQVGMAGPQTVVGDAVGLAMTVFERSEQEDRVLILLTDGNDTGSKVPPADAARIGRDRGVTIHTIAVGDPTAAGEEKIDEETLKEMATVTGGNFYRANDRQQLEGIYETLDGLETRELETESYRPKSELFFWPLGAFLLIGLLWHGFHAIRYYVPAAAVAQGVAVAGFIAVLLSAAAAGWPAAAGPEVRNCKLQNENCKMKIESTVSECALLAQRLLPISDLRPPATISSFHFLRPFWLITLAPVVVLVVGIMRKQDVARGLQQAIQPHLLKHLVVAPKTQSRIRPVYLLALAWVLTVIAMAGPTWEREPSPFASDEAALVFVQAVKPTMMAQDIQPSRLQRSVQKIGDLLKLRSGADAALVAYSGTAHLVMPITRDADIIVTFAGELDPQIMPKSGDAVADAIKLANEQLKGAGRSGSIILITDEIDPAQNSLLAEIKGAPIHILAVAGGQSKPLPIDSPPAPAINMKALQVSANTAGATLTMVTADDSDVRGLSRKIDTSFAAAAQDDGGSRWRDLGYWLMPLIALMALYWFRRGWMIPWN